MEQSLKINKRAAIYLRVSTDEQVKEGYGLVYQEEKLRQFIASQEYTLDEKHVYRDEGYSGASSSEYRPALKQLLEDAQKKDFDVLLVYRIDRLFRKAVLLIQIVEKLNSFGVGFRSITESFDTTNITGKFVMTMLGAMAEMERDTIRERTINGRLSAARTGKWVVGLPPYGYRVNKKTKKLIIQNDEAKIVKKFYEWMVYERLSLKAIARRINSMGIDSPKHIFINRRKTHNYWYERTIGRILTNEIYTGTTYFRKYKRPFKNLNSVISDDLKRPVDDWIKIPVPPIISAELFEAATGQLLENRENASRNLKRKYLFTKIIYCGSCGFTMLSGFQKPTHLSSTAGRHYHGAYRRADAPGTTKRCEHCPQYAESRLEPIWDCLKSILQHPENIKKPLERYRFHVVDTDNVQEQITALEQKIKSIGNKEQKLVALYLQDDSMEKRTFEGFQREYKNNKNQTQTEILKLKQSLLRKGDERDRSKILHDLYSKIKSRLENATYEEKAEIIRLFIERIILHQRNNYAEVIFKFPTNQIKAGGENTKNSINLVLDVKTFSEKEIQQKTLEANPLMNHKK